jgi:hypothetical protein
MRLGPLTTCVLVASCASFGGDDDEPSGPTAPQAGAIACGAGGICAKGSVCCFENHDGPTACKEPSQCMSVNQYRAFCDATADCAAGQVCCLLLQGGFKGIESTCVFPSACPADADHRRMCDPVVERECGSAQSCATLQSAVAGAAWPLRANVCQ